MPDGRRETRRIGARAGRRLFMLAFVSGGLALAQTPAPGQVRLLEVEGVINPLTARYLQRSLHASARARDLAVVLRLNTPGGLETAMRQMIEDILASPAPVIVHVAPPGARAASAGMFLTIAGHVAAMAPGTNIGAAHPVDMGGELDETAVEKAVSDAAALARSLAEIRGRNAAWVEQAVRESVSVTAEEALELGVIDLVADDVDTLLSRLEGREIVTAAGTAVLRTAGARRVDTPMTFIERILHVITDPNIAYLLFTLGVVGLIAELYNPGAVFPGLTGLVSLVLAFVAFGSLPVSGAGVLLVLLGIVLFIVDIYSEGIGLLTVGAVIAFVLGSLLLYVPVTPASPAEPQVRVSPWLVALMAAAMLGFFLVVVRALVQARRAPVVSGMRGMVGHEAVATTDLSPSGRVRLDGEDWTAIAEGGAVASGQRVRVTGVHGVTLSVTAIGEEART